MDFRLGDEIEAFRAEVRAFVEAHMTPELDEEMYRTGTSHDPDFVTAMRDRGWYLAGGSDGSDGATRTRHPPLEFMVLREEFQWHDAPMYSIGTTLLAAKAIIHAGTEQQKRDVLPKALSGETIVVLGFSEPEAGSDVANVQTRAVRDGDEWLINGSKMFTTNAHVADYVFLLTRTNTEVPKHQGLTVFLVPLDQPGVEVQAVYTLSGERTNITYLNDVRVEDRWRIGEVDGGWRVMMAGLQEEHSNGFGSRIGRMLDEAEEWARATTSVDGRARIEDPDVRERLARAAMECEVSHLLERRGAWMVENGMVPEAEGPMAKLFSSEAMERSSQELCEMIGPDALRSFFEPTAPRGGRIEHAQRFSLGTTIYAGTSEIQRNIIASRGLGLPR